MALAGDDDGHQGGGLPLFATLATHNVHLLVTAHITRAAPGDTAREGVVNSEKLIQ